LKNIHWQESTISLQDRFNLLNQYGLVIWFTGLSGAGKSTIAFALQKQLHQEKYLTYCLDGDNIRHGLNADLGFGDQDRKENIRRIAEVAALFKDAGIITLVSCISPHQDMRNYARKCIGAENFIEVYVKASIETCQRRDVKGLYKKIKKNEIKEFTGISSDYEEPNNADIILDTDFLNVSGSVSRVFDYLMAKFISQK
jgi:adenylylsulfate kinase